MSLSISVIVPAYNGAHFMSATLDSVFAQTRLPSEIIVVDDGSTDETIAVVESRRPHTPVPLRVIRHPRNSGGPAVPINTGVAAAQGEYVAICEQDDLMAPNKLERVGELLARDPGCTLVVSRYQVHVEEGRQGVAITDDAYSRFEDIGREQIGENMYILESRAAYRMALQFNFAASLSNMVFRRSALMAELRPDEGVCRATDCDLLLKAARMGRIGLVDERLWMFRRHANSAVTSTGWDVWSRDHGRILLRELRAAENAEQMKMVRGRLRDCLMWAGWRYRDERRYYSALSAYVRCLWHAGCSGESLVEILKIAPHFVLRHPLMSRIAFRKTTSKR